MSALVKALQAVGQSHSLAAKRYLPPPLDQLRKLAQELGGVGMKFVPPESSELQRIFWPQVQAWLSSELPAKALPLDVWKSVPSLLWWPHEGRQAIGYARLRDGIVWAASMSVPRTSWVEALATAYTEASGATEESHQWLGNTLRRWCGETMDQRLNVWRRRDRYWELFSPSEFPAKLSSRLQSSPEMTVRGALVDAGLSTAPSQAADLSRLAFITFLKIPIAAAQGYDQLHLERICEWKTLVLGESAAWHKEFSAAVINGLLEPWASFNPPEVEFQKQIQRTLGEWFGPASEEWTGDWSGASALSREILARWKVLDVMEAFFQRVGEYAAKSGNATMTRQWSYRRNFWLAYYKKGVVTHARALIGRGMMAMYGQQALQMEFGKAMAELQAQDAQQCGLLLQINELTLIDLSHDGAAYFFLPSNNRKPSINATSYDRTRLGMHRDDAKSHHGAEIGRWQRSFESFIFDHTGIKLKPGDYGF